MPFQARTREERGSIALRASLASLALAGINEANPNPNLWRLTGGIMLQFSTEISLEPTTDIESIVTVLYDWIIKSPYSKFDAKDFEEAIRSETNSGHEWIVEQSGDRVEFGLTVGTDYEICGLRYTVRDGKSIFTSEVVAHKTPDSVLVGIKVIPTSDVTTLSISPPKKPHLIKLLLKEFGGIDGGKAVEEYPLYLKTDDVELACNLIGGQFGQRLPIIYVSYTTKSHQNIHIGDIAYRLSALAHVIVEPDFRFARRLANLLDFQTVSDGDIGIYWPDVPGLRFLFKREEYKTHHELTNAIYDNIASSLANRSITRSCTWSYLKEILSRAQIERIKSSGSVEVGDYIAAFDEELKAKQDQIRDLEQENLRLKSEYRKTKKSREDSNLHLKTTEADYYQGERLHVVMQAIKKASGQTLKESRSFHILNDIIINNISDNTAAKIGEELKSTLREYSSMTHKVENLLSRIGFDLTSDGKHIKAVYKQDPRYTFSIPKSGSDHRGGLEPVWELARL